jgi:hypothetical protein
MARRKRKESRMAWMGEGWQPGELAVRRWACSLRGDGLPMSAEPGQEANASPTRSQSTKDSSIVREVSTDRLGREPKKARLITGGAHSSPMRDRCPASNYRGRHA